MEELNVVLEKNKEKIAKCVNIMRELGIQSLEFQGIKITIFNKK